MIDAFAMRGNCIHVLVSILVVCDEDMIMSDCRPIGSFIGVNDQIGNLDIISTQLMSSL